MEHGNLRELASLEAYPNISAAATILGVASSTLSRRPDLRTEPRGERDLVLRPGEVLRLAGIYRKRSINDVAQGLLDYARREAEGEVLRVEREIEEFFGESYPSPTSRDEFLRVARRMLPANLYRQVEKTVLQAGGELGFGLLGEETGPED